MSKKKYPTPLKTTSTSRTLAVKCYEEQLPKGEQNLYEKIKTTPKNESHIIAIKHYKGGKTHWHVIEKSVQEDPHLYVASELKRLGIVFRKGMDEEIIRNHGLETVVSFEQYCCYLLHNTDKAKRDNKPVYEAAELISNLSGEEITEILAGNKTKKKRITAGELDVIFKNAGYELQNFYNYVDEMEEQYAITINEIRAKKAYISGLKKRTRENRSVNRLCIKIITDTDADFNKALLCSKEVLKNSNLQILNTIELDVNKRIQPWIESIINITGDFYINPKKNFAYIYENSELNWEGKTYISIDKRTMCRGHEPGFIECEIADGKLKCIYTDVIVSESKRQDLLERFSLFAKDFNNAYANDSSKEHKTVYKKLTVDELNSLI